MTKEELSMLENGSIYRFTEIYPNVFRIENSAVHMDLLVGEHHALLFDTGYGFDDLHGLVRRITNLPLYVVNSHGHVDHAAGNWQFGEVFIHPADVPVCIEHNGREMRMAEMETAVLPENFDLEGYLSRDCGHLRQWGRAMCSILAALRWMWWSSPAIPPVPSDFTGGSGRSSMWAML